MLELHLPRVLVCGSRRWPWPDTVTDVLDRLHARYGDQLVIIEGSATGADRAAHRWCEDHGLPAWRHRCYPIAWAAERRRLPQNWQSASLRRNQRMLIAEEPRLVIAFHEDFNPALEGTADTCLLALLLGTPVWLAPTDEPSVGAWLSIEHFPSARATRFRKQFARVQSALGLTPAPRVTALGDG